MPNSPSGRTLRALIALTAPALPPAGFPWAGPGSRTPFHPFRTISPCPTDATAGPFSSSLQPCPECHGPHKAVPICGPMSQPCLGLSLPQGGAQCPLVCPALCLGQWDSPGCQSQPQPRCPRGAPSTPKTLAQSYIDICLDWRQYFTV